MIIHPIITGCGLTINSEFRIWGDLWDAGDVYIFNACGDAEGLPQPFSDTTKQLIVPDLAPATYFQRRNVFVISKYDSHLNPAALHYVKDLAS